MSKHVSMFVHSLTDHIDEINIANANFHEISQHMNENINFIKRENIINIKTLKKFFKNDYEKSVNSSTRREKLLQRLRKKLDDKKKKE
jgi:hypothetical protein